MSNRSVTRICVALLLGYVAILISQVNHGVATLDAHGIIGAVQRWIAGHEFPISRPPGHPTTELYLFPTVAWVLHLFGYTFGDRAYLLAQTCGAIAALVVFYDLLRALDVSPGRAGVAVAALALSAQFFANAVDGEEFDLAVFFVLLAVRLLVAAQPVNNTRLFLSALSFALATGCRPEIIFAGIIYPIYLICIRAETRRVLWVVFAVPATLILVWLPMIIHGMHPPLGAGVTVRDAILAGGYKLLFQAFGLPVFLLLLFVLARALWNWRAESTGAFPQKFARLLACTIPLLFFALFFRYPTKPAHVLFALPFLLIAAAESPVILLAIAVLTFADDFVRIDIFRDRHLTSPYLASGGALAAVHQKPFYRLAYLRELRAQCEDRPCVVVGDVWRWDIEYHIQRGSFPAVEKVDAGGAIPQFVPATAPQCTIVPRGVAFAPAELRDWRSRDVVVKMDAVLYQTAFARYGRMQADAPTDVTLFSLGQ
ncbi:MAG: hypothetical protein ACJ8HQ_02760 [Chthoniobacterales bacterium]